MGDPTGQHRNVTTLEGINITDKIEKTNLSVSTSQAVRSF
jgi:hypothetical protein